MSDIYAGQVWQFNRVKAVVLSATDDEIIWRQADAMKRHKTPRWFFEKHSEFLMNILLDGPDQVTPATPAQR